MNILISGGSGFLGKALTSELVETGHNVWVLTRQKELPATLGVRLLHWDGRTTEGWGPRINEMEVVIHLAGKTLASWPWTRAKKRLFFESRARTAHALIEAIRQAQRRPRLFIQQSGINYYGLQGETADENTPPAADYLARLLVDLENAVRVMDELGVRRVTLRSAVVLARRGGMLPMMALPVQLFVGGPIAGGRQATPWIHLQDWVKAVHFLIDSDNASGAYNLISPTSTSSAEFYSSLARVLHRPYWFPAPAFILRTILGQMSVFILCGRTVRPARLLESGFKFRFAKLDESLSDIYQ